MVRNTYFLVFTIKRHYLYIITILCSRPNAKIKIQYLLQLLLTFTVQIYIYIYIDFLYSKFWNHHHAKKLGETYENLLACNPPKMPRKVLPRIIDNEPESETEIRKQLSIEKFKSEIALLHSRSQRYIQRYQNMDSEMVAHITHKFNEEVAQGLIKKLEEDCKEQEGISMVIFNKKEHWIEENATSGFHTDPVYRNRPGTSTEQTRNRNFRALEGSRDRQQEERRPFFDEFRPRSLSRNRRPNRYRNTSQSRGRRPMRGRTQRRQDNQTRQRERFPSQQRNR